MPELSKTYEPQNVEEKWYSHWMEQGFFHARANKDKKPYSIVIPPPNVTGVLHMGHMLNNTIQDVLIRRARMQGYEACWVPGTDHASIATEAKVVAQLKEQGKTKEEIGREEFLKHAFEWKEKYGGIILEQLKKLGASCDWDRTRFTMEDDLSAAVNEVFVKLYNKGYIYRGVRMVNWDPEGKTALSDEEVIHKEVDSQLYYVKYKIEGEDDYLTIATTRPETILADTAICVNPNDERFTHLKGKQALVPLTERSIPIIQDEYVDMEFGTGCLKVTPAHDINDYELGIKHKLKVIDSIDEDGKMNEHAAPYAGQDRFECRKNITRDIEAAGQLDKVDTIKNKVGRSERTNAVIEPRLSMQWFLKMEELVKPATENVMNDNIRFYPDKFKNMYSSWMENIRDWCISRQLWWGQRIPAWYYGDGTDDFVVAHTEEEALQLAKEKSTNQELTTTELRQDEDVVDTWFSSWLWPISVFDGFKEPDNEDFQYFYPTTDLVTGFDIIFFWVARMIMAGYEFKGEKPFQNVYFTGMVRDEKRRKMSKQLGNSPDALMLIDKYGADGVRVGMLLSSSAGNDLLFDEKLCEQGRNFTNKIWNALRLVKGWEVKEGSNEDNQIVFDWFEAKLNAAATELEDLFSKFRISEALMLIYKLVWDDFCSWYLEMVKPGFEQAIDSGTYDKTLDFFESLMKLIHPFMPFISEEVWHNLREREEKQCVIVADWPESAKANTDILKSMEATMEVISGIRNIKKENNLSPKAEVSLMVKSPYKGFDNAQSIIQKLANVTDFQQADGNTANAKTFMVGTSEFAIPVEIDAEQEKVKLQKELEYQKGFLTSVDKKLSNERFVSGAPEQVIENERKKKADAESKIKALEESLANL